MKVIGAGLLRTGTLSTLTALVANILKKAGYSKVSARKAPSFLLKIIGLFDREVKGMLPMLGKKASFDNRATFEVLDWKATPIEVSLKDMAAAISP